MVTLVSVRLVFLVVAVAFVAFVTAGPTTCETYKETGIRCEKEGAPFDQVLVQSKNGTRVTFQVAFWISWCRKQGMAYRHLVLDTKPGCVPTLDMEKTDQDKCRELFFFGCKVNGVTEAPCADVLEVERA